MRLAAVLLSRLRADERGVSTVEFAIVASAFIMLVIGGMYVSMLGYTVASLHYAVEAAARCYSVNTTTCTSTATTQTYATAHFTNLTGNTATFVASTPTCGHQVTGQLTYKLNAGVYRRDITLPTATACFP